MKAILTSSLSLLTLAFVALRAQAAPSWLAINTEAYGKDASPSADSKAYSAYYCTTEAAASMFGGKSSVADVTAYFAKNFSSGLKALGQYDADLRAENDYVQTIDWDTLSEQYVFTDSFADALTVGDFLAIVLYQNGSDAAVRVLGNADWTAGNVAFDSLDETAAAGTIGDWTAATVPEPTGGLLFLLGLAGLALRRRAR